MIEIDGSVGEGGGQILRTSLALSMCSGQPFRIVNIRAKRKKPGLMRQHLTAVEAAQTVCGAEIDGAAIASQHLVFRPGAVKAGDYHFAVGTAGSATLVLQTVLPALLQGGGRSVVRLEGGTHNQWAPPFHFLAGAFLPALAKMGATCEAVLDTWGFQPAGGGKFVVTINPPTAGRLAPLDLCDRGALVRAEVLAAVGQIDHEIADDESRLIVTGVRFPIDKRRAEQVSSVGPGNVALLEMQFANVNAVFTGFGSLGISRRGVAGEVIRAANRFFKSAAAVEEHLADQLLIPMAMAGSGSFTTTEPTLHTITNAQVIRQFLPVNIDITDTGSGIWRIDVHEQA